MMVQRERRIHDAPWLRFSDPATAYAFLGRFGVSCECGSDLVLRRVTEAFKRVPYENLTKILKADSVISAASAMRYPDEVIGDFLRWGTGGTCFSLTAALIALLDVAGIDAWPILADRHYGVDTHCGILIAPQGANMLLLDPGYLLFAPIPVPLDFPAFIETGFNRVELRPLAGASRVELYTIVKGNRKLRLTFKMEPVSDESFGGAWERSFAFEMMTYPVLTRRVNGRHQYLQGDVLAVRDALRTERTTLTPEMQIEFFTTSANMDRGIVTRALEIVNYGRNATAVSR
jgi:hypothetical protein